ncbi:hypothetical protein AVEN_49110-1 [Araneus ventricosus]|uniref:Uncharacterized protein n=1 Tax=Araneus ventricosus TaxID=182803 RepID=A0A4Y2BZB7_ARAVE|nr:hypothetical protein AVEN_49110-1 [Araneus ventricosus]
MTLHKWYSDSPELLNTCAEDTLLSEIGDQRHCASYRFNDRPGMVEHACESFEDIFANRVSKVQGLTENCCWTHVPSHLNPVDLVSRGLSPRDLHELKLWWNGPSFLGRSELSPDDHP